MKKLLMTTSVLESVTGLGMLMFPSIGSSLLLGPPIDSDNALVIARFAAVAILALAVACWLARRDENALATKGLVIAMSLFNAGAVVVLLHANLGYGLAGGASWPATILHALMGTWCVRVLLSKQREGSSVAVK